MWSTFAEQEREAKPWLLHAFVNVQTSPEVAERFNVRTTPAFILLRNGKAHRFNAGYADAISPSLIDGLSSFSKNGWSSVKSEAIPPEHPKRPGLSSTALIGYVAGAAMLSITMAFFGSYLSSYFKAATPVLPKHD